MFVIDSATAMRVLREDDAAELFALTDANRDYLRRWLPWVDLVTSEDDSHSFLATVTAQREEGRGPTFGILCDGALAGVVGYLPIDRVNRVGEIGYWLAERAQAPRRDDAMLPLRGALRVSDARPESHPDRGRHGESSRAARCRSGSASSSKASCAGARTSTARSSTMRCTRCCAATSIRPTRIAPRACPPRGGLPK